MPFTVTQFKVETADGRNVRLLEPVTYYTNVRGRLEPITLPAGTESDGGSIPHECWSIPGFAPFGTAWRGFVVHDFLYRQSDWPREDCDKVLLEAMTNLGVDKAHRLAIYNAVRLFGGSAFEEDKKLKDGK